MQLKNSIDNEAERLHVVSFSGGKDSTYMVLEMIRRGMPIDAVLNADTGMEFPAMYEHIDKIDRLLAYERGINITRLKSSKTFEELMLDAVRTTGENLDVIGYGWPGVFVRWCTGQLKTHLMDAYTKSFALQPYQYVAIAADEEYRLQRKQNQGEFRRHPLVDWNVTEAQALAGCYRAGYTWDGLYEKFSRVSCWCCPLQSLKELRNLRDYYPEVWEKLRNLDNRAIAQFGRDSPLGQFRRYESVRMLEVRFDFEKEWVRTRGAPNSKLFFAELNELYRKVFPFESVRTAKPTRPKYPSAAALLPFVTDEDLADGMRTNAVQEQRKKLAVRQNHER